MSLNKNSRKSFTKMNKLPFFFDIVRTYVLINLTWGGILWEIAY